MPKLSTPLSKPLIAVKTSGYSLLSVVAAVVGFGLVAMEIAAIVRGLDATKPLWIQLIPGGAGIVLLAIVAAMGRQKGQLDVYLDRIQGKRPNGLAVNIDMTNIGMIDLRAHHVAIKDVDGKLILVQKFGRKGDGGVIWLAKSYGDWDQRIWQAFDADISSNLEQAARQFLNEDGSPSFADIGFLLESGGQRWYFPTSPTVDLQSLGSSQRRPNQPSRKNFETPIQFDPQPDCLPLDKFCMAISDSKLPATLLVEYLETLAENHGGNPVQATEEPDFYLGECIGCPVKIQGFPT